MKAELGFYEFFAGGGMARVGLSPSWHCRFANDIDPKKAATYVRNWGDDELVVRNVAELLPDDLPGEATLSWASFPCQDLSLAGNGAGLQGSRSGTFWSFWALMKGLRHQGRAPALLVIENVCGTLTSHQGQDFATLAAAIAGEGYCLGALVIDAVRFLPQSRPRLFIVAASESIRISADIVRDGPDPKWHTSALIAAHAKLRGIAREKWVWWNLPTPTKPVRRFSELAEDDPQGIIWHTRAETQRLLEMMSPINRRKVREAQRSGERIFGTLYKRTRRDSDGRRQQRAEVRFDEVAGCLRTPAGGSSRQFVVIVEGRRIRSRLLSPREAARLMGLPDDYTLPENYNEAYHIAGDGLAVPLIRHLSEHLLEPLAQDHCARRDREAA